MPDRSIRVTDDVWRRAKAACGLRGESLSGFTTAALEARLRGVLQVDDAVLARGRRVVEAVEWPLEAGSAASVPSHGTPPSDLF